LLAWLVPGLGHWYQGRRAKAALFFVLLMGTFGYGVYLGGDSQIGWGRVVYATWRPDDRRWQYFCQLPAGLAAMPALVQAVRVETGHKPWSSGFMAPPALNPAAGPTLADIAKRLGRYFELGTVYTMIAGLLNVLVIYDAWGGPVGGKPPAEAAASNGPSADNRRSRRPGEPGKTK
jgi:hypothetical protein